MQPPSAHFYDCTTVLQQVLDKLVQEGKNNGDILTQLLATGQESNTTISIATTCTLNSQCIISIKMSDLKSAPARLVN